MVAFLQGLQKSEETSNMFEDWAEDVWGFCTWLFLSQYARFDSGSVAPSFLTALFEHRRAIPTPSQEETTFRCIDVLISSILHAIIYLSGFDPAIESTDPRLLQERALCEYMKSESFKTREARVISRLPRNEVLFSIYRCTDIFFSNLVRSSCSLGIRCLFECNETDYVDAWIWSFCYVATNT